MSLSQVTIFGAGLIGGSVALALRKAGYVETLVAIDRAPAPPESVFDSWIQADNDDAVERALAASQLVVLCVPVGAIIRLLPQVLDSTPGWVTDCGSTKWAIEKSVQDHPARGRFVPGHPMAGHPRGGLENARDDLFSGRKWILCQGASSSEAYEGVSDVVRAVGAELVELGSQEHDASVAVTSHVPQVVASVLAAHAHQQSALAAAGPGFASATRVAGGAEAMWRDIFETNAGAIGRELLTVGRQLQDLGKELHAGAVSGTLDVLEEARRAREPED